MGNEKARPVARVCTASALAEEKLLLSLVVLLWMHRSLLPSAGGQGGRRGGGQEGRGAGGSVRGDGALQVLKRPMWPF